MNTNNKLGYREGVVSVVLNLLLFVLKYYAGIVSASVALIADAWHTLSDSLTSLVVIFGIRMSSRKPDKEHPFGHGRWEQISAIIIAILLAVVGLEFVKDSIGRLSSREAADFGWWAYGATLVSIYNRQNELCTFIKRNVHNFCLFCLKLLFPIQWKKRKKLPST